MPTHPLRLAALSAPLLQALTSLSHAETPRGSYMAADPARVEILDPGGVYSHSSNIIFLNGCFGDGCDVTPGDDSSINNSSSLPLETSHLAPFSGGQMQWDAIVNCVRDTYSPFDIVITDDDPGSVPHFEAMVAGSPRDLGMNAGVGGVAPFMCGKIINNSISFAFPEVFENDVAETCWIIAQETAHAFGLDHEFLCSDPMTYLQGCDPRKYFQDIDAQCGEFQARPCQCEGPTQNSYRRLLQHFGPGVPSPPTLEITSPADGALVDPGFVVRTSARDDIQVTRVELRVNSMYVGVSESEPYLFNVPATMSDGRMRVEASAFDNYNNMTTRVIEVLQGEPCKKSLNCGDFEACVDGRCVPGPEAPGGLGQSCTRDTDCASLQCGSSSEGSFCAESCTVGGTGCSDGFGCLETGDRAVCWPGYDDSEGGCSVGSSSKQANWVLAFSLLALCRRRR